MEDKDIFETQWEQELPPENEMKQIRRTIRKRNGRIIAISVVLAAVILLGSVYGIVPLIERFYWHPGTETAAANASDLTLTMHAYTELFCPGWNVTHINWQKTDGLAAYDLQFNILDLGKREYFRLDGKLEKGKLMYGPDFSDHWAQSHWFSGFVSDMEALEKYHLSAAQEKLRELPEYIAIQAAISFPEDLNMEQVVQFYENTQDLPLQINWVGIRNCEVKERPDLMLDGSEPLDRTGPIRLCGMNPFGGGTYFFASEDNHSYFPDPLEYPSQESLEGLFKSLLQYSSDQCAKGEGIPLWTGKDYYQTVLDYVEENGIMSYGAVVVASPKTLLELLDEGVISHVTILDGWIDLS